MFHKLKKTIYRCKYNFANKLNLKKPVDVMLELSSHCNMSCHYCYHAKKPPFQKGFMSFETAKRIIDSTAEAGVNSIKFNYRGESMLNPDYCKILRYAHSKARGMTFIDRIVNSNFTFRHWNLDIIEALCLQTKVKISYDSFRWKIFNKHRGGGEIIHAVVAQNITNFYHHPNRKNTEIVIQAVRTDWNANEDIEGKVKEYWPDAKVSIRDMVSGRTDSPGDLKNKSRNKKERVPCLQAFARLIFDHDGNAQACCPDIESKIFLGHINNQSVLDIWNGHAARKNRKDLKSGLAFKYSPCDNCSSFESYKGFKPNWES